MPMSPAQVLFTLEARGRLVKKAGVKDFMAWAEQHGIPVKKES